MYVMRKKKLHNPFMIDGKPCIVCKLSFHSIRIFYDNHVYDVLLSDDEISNWNKSGTIWRKEFITKNIEEIKNGILEDDTSLSIRDGYLA